MAAVGKAAVRYHLRQSELERDVAAAVKLRTAAKRMAYNVAANCWPGWGDEGVVIEAAHIDVGLELAMLSLRLVEELAGPSSARHCPLARRCLSTRRRPTGCVLIVVRTGARRLRVNRRDDQRAACGRLPRDRASSGARSSRSRRSGIGRSDRQACDGWLEAGEGVCRPAPDCRARS